MKVERAVLAATLLLAQPALSAPRMQAAPAVAEAIVEDQLHDYFAAQSARGGLNGQVLVAENGRAVYHAAFGLADRAAGRANSVDTEFELASVAKVFTATAVLQLVERGLIELDAPLRDYFPDFPYSDITIRQLLSHSSGLSDQDIGDYQAAFETRTGRAMTMADVPKAVALADRPLKLKPGERWWYCNLGYVLLARLVEERSGQPFQIWLQDHILGPAGMRQTYLRTAQINRDATPLVARNYDYARRYSPERELIEGERGYYNGVTFGDANIVSTAADLLRFDEALRAGQLLRPETLEAAYTPARLADGAPVFVWLNIGSMGEADDGLGWFVFRDQTPGRIVWHAGGMPGSRSIFLRDLDHGRTVIVLDNHSSENGYRTALSAMRILAGLPPLATPISLARQFGRTLVSKGETAAVAELEARRADDGFSLSEDDMNNLGYEFLTDGRLSEALITFRENARLFPASDNAFNSYGEALESAGDMAAARDVYARSLALNPDNADSRSDLERVKAAMD